jgi:hypothetical protein
VSSAIAPTTTTSRPPCPSWPFAEPPRSIQQFVDYLDMFARYKELPNLTAMGTVLDANPDFNPAERAMLGRHLRNSPTTPKLTLQARFARTLPTRPRRSSLRFPRRLMMRRSSLPCRSCRSTVCLHAPSKTTHA